MESGWCYVQTIQKLEKELIELKKENERLKQLIRLIQGEQSEKGENQIIQTDLIKHT